MQIIAKQKLLIIGILKIEWNYIHSKIQLKEYINLAFFLQKGFTSYLLELLCFVSKYKTNKIF